jgi:hypothetical protein
MVSENKSGEAKPCKDIINVLEQIWADQKARGHIPRTREEIDAEIQHLRDEAEEEFLAIEHLQEECRRQRERQP